MTRKPTSMFSRVALSALVTSTSLALLAGCITVNVPEPVSSTTTVKPTPSASTFEAEPAETATTEPEEESSQEPTQEPQPEAVRQTVDFFIGGGCQDSYEAIGDYALFEEFEDDCYLTVEVFPPSPARYAELQHFDSTWITESSGYTDAEGVLYLDVDPYCDDDYWCDGVWDFRVLVEAEEKQPAERSDTFALEFIPWG